MEKKHVERMDPDRFYHMLQEVAEVWGDAKTTGKRP
jgi:hypothetical protein